MTCGRPSNEFQFQNHARFINLLVSLSNTKFGRSRLNSATTFEFGTLAIGGKLAIALCRMQSRHRCRTHQCGGHRCSGHRGVARARTRRAAAIVRRQAQQPACRNPESNRRGAAVFAAEIRRFSTKSAAQNSPGRAPLRCPMTKPRLKMQQCHVLVHGNGHAHFSAYATQIDRITDWVRIMAGSAFASQRR
jgi:hypothetical protein